MTDEPQYTRREFIRHTIEGATAGGALGALTYKEPKPAPNKPLVDSDTELAKRVGGGAVMGALVRILYGRSRKKPPPPYSQDRQDRIREDHEEGRDWEYWQKRHKDNDDQGREK